MNDLTDRCADDYEARRLAALADYGILDTPPEPAFDDIVEVISCICDTPIAVINLVDRDRQWFKSVKGLAVRETPLDISICVEAILQPGLFVVPDTTRDPRFASNPLVTGDPHLRFYAGALLESANGFPIGTLCVLDYQPRELDERQRFALQALANQVMAHLELMRAHREQADLIRELDAARRELTRKAFTDSLTGLLNRRAFEDRLAKEADIIQLGGLPAMLLLMDLDHFKCINDSYGHHAGDRALTRFAELCMSVFRKADIVGRWGGEEFVALLPATTPEEATAAAERLRQQLLDTPLLPDLPNALHATISVGICTIAAGCDLEERIHTADQLMYRAKQQGRNCIVSE